MADEKKATLAEINKAVEEGLEAARKASDDKDLDKMIEDLEKSWEKVCYQFMILMAGIVGFKYRSKATIIKQLETYKIAMKNGKHESLFSNMSDTVH